MYFKIPNCLSFSAFWRKNIAKSYFDPHLECTAPKCWSKNIQHLSHFLLRSHSMPLSFFISKCLCIFSSLSLSLSLTHTHTNSLSFLCLCFCLSLSLGHSLTNSLSVCLSVSVSLNDFLFIYLFHLMSITPFVVEFNLLGLLLKIC